MQAHGSLNEGLVPSDFIEIPPRALLDRDCLLLAIESSIRVRAHAHFFSWTQGALQTVLPHNILLCAAYDHDGAILFADVMSVQPVRTSWRESLLKPNGGLLAELARLWQRGDRNPIVYDLQRDDILGDPTVRTVLDELKIGTVIAHGAVAPDGALDTFFAFSDVAAAVGEDVALVVEIILPHVRAALLRVQRRSSVPSTRSIAHGLTVRERDVLRLLQQGRSNAEIGAALSISPLTVKNHVQKLLRKLGVRNRTQAVALDVLQRWRA